MPVSEFSWTSMPYQPPIFQVYGTKRKAGENSDELQECQDPSKRQCIWSSTAHPEQQTGGNTLQGNNNIHDGPTQITMQRLSPGKVHPQLEQVALMHTRRSPSPWPSESMETMVNNHHSDHKVPRSHTLQDDYAQGDHIMDLNDELFNPSCSDEAAQMSMAMDSDCVPNPQQYGSRYSDRISGMGEGDGVCTSSMVKCYCRPSWEGYASSKPYVSDYY